MFAPAYFDHNATTPLDPAVLEAMLPWLAERSGNPSSRHEYGRATRAAVDRARQQVAEAVGAHPTEIIFTSGGSESNNLIVKGFAATQRPSALAVGATEHPSVLAPAEQLVRAGWQLRQIGVDEQGRIDREDYDLAVAGRPALVSLMLANNETGVVEDIAMLAGKASDSGAVFHTDAVQALGRLPLDFRSLNAAGVRAMTLSAHKAGGPKGAAALVIDKRIELQPLVAGGGQERGLRSGTENVAAIVGFGLACELAKSRQKEAALQMKVLRDRLETELTGLGATVFGAGARRLPNTSYFAFAELDGETLVGRLDRGGFAVASGSACSSANPKPSHVLAAMGITPEFARGAVRVSLGSGNDGTQVEALIGALRQTVSGLRQLTAIAA